MENLSLLPFVVLLTVAASPLVVAAAWSSDSDDVVFLVDDSSSEPIVRCGGSYGANSTYEANLRHLAAVLPAETSASQGHSVERAIGYWPSRVQARANCWTNDGDGDCATCIAKAFKEVERQCPFHREASFSGRDCCLRFAEFRIFSLDVLGRNTMAQTLVMGMMFQALGLACLFFLFLQAWRHEPHDGKKGTMTRHTPLPSGDKYLSGLATRLEINSSDKDKNIKAQKVNGE